MPPFDTVTVYFLKDIIEGTKRFVSTQSVRHLAVPQYQNLSMKCILDFLAQFEAMHLHMPSESHEIAKLPRGWIINIGATVVG